MTDTNEQTGKIVGRWYDKHEAAALTHICKRKLDYERAKGRLPFYQIGYRILFAENDLLDFMAQFRVDKTATGRN